MKRSRPLQDRMWAEALEMIDRAERLQRQFFQPAARGVRGWQPPADVYETDEHVWVVIALPGVSFEGLNVHLRANWLEIRGLRRLPVEAQRGLIHRLELPHGEFARRIELPAYRYTLDGQQYDDGCLYLKLHKS